MSELASKQLLLHYWKIPGRASLPYMLLKICEMPVEYICEASLEEKETYKTSAPFGQLPVLVDRANDVVIAQSAAVAVYAARLTNLDGLSINLKTYANSLQYIELESELMTICGKALYTGESGSIERGAAWKDAKSKIDKLLLCVVRNLGTLRFLNEGLNEPTAADLALFSAMMLLTSASLWGDSLFQKFPTLRQHYAECLTVRPELAEVAEEISSWEPYYKFTEAVVTAAALDANGEEVWV